MKNPLSLVKQTRKRYDKELQKTVLEVQIQVGNAPKAWINLETLLELQKQNQNQENQND